MKKYLMNAALTLALGGLMVSCSDDNVDFVSIANQKAQAFEKVFNDFAAEYGGINPNNTWGFTDDYTVADTTGVEAVVTVEDEVESTLLQTRAALLDGIRARTRADINVNGNQWQECPSLQATEEADVTAYVNMTRAEMTAQGHKYTETFPENITDYYVTQVHMGTDTYKNLDGGDTGTGSSHMNHLQINESASGNINADGSLGDGWFHVNNFNGGDNKDWKGNTLVTNAGTKDFAYHGTEDSRYHNKWIAVDGANIAPQYAGYYYICFDFVSFTGDVKTNFQVPGYGNIVVSGYYSSVEEAVKAGAKGIYWAWDSNTQSNYPVEVAITSDSSIGNVVNGNQVVPANDVYTDWIVRIVKAKKNVITTGEVKKDSLIDDWYEVTGQAGRIFCEDLGQATREDLDYNDVVFDVRIWEHHVKKMHRVYERTYVNGSYDANNDVYLRDELVSDNTDPYAEVILKAAGGTLPLQVVGKEVHAAFGVDVATMVNTRDGNSTAFGSYESKDEVAIGDETIRFTDVNGNYYTKVLTKGISSAIKVPIVVNYDGNEVQELHANPGKAPHKLLVPLGTPWATERKNLALAYPDFGNFINDADKVWTNNPNTAYIYSGNTASTESPKVFRTVRVYNSSDDILWSTTARFGSSWTLQSQNITLSVDKFWPGDILRFHCKDIPATSDSANTDDQAWININFGGEIGQVYDNQVVNYDPQTGAQSSTCCVEFLITEALAEKMNSAISDGTMQITVAGRNFTLERVARKPFDK